MPELPEVETVRRQLEAHVVGRRVGDVEVRFAGRLNLSAKLFAQSLRGATVTGVERRAKLLSVHFDNGRTMHAHLKMSGRFLLVPVGTAPTKHTHVVFHLDHTKEECGRTRGERDLFFEDTRKFGYLRVHATKDAAREMPAYGPEPLDDAMDPAAFRACLVKVPKRKLKATLLDQACIAGVGNIYADESCFAARILPTRATGSLSVAETTALRRELRRLLEASIARGGTSSEMFLDLFGVKGDNVRFLKVYGREGEPCARCKTPITKTVLVGRGTHFCKSCQK
jgi:formamidopyrimidine-DNA glycosylase